MRLFHIVSIVSLFTILTTVSSVTAEEQYLEFLQGLRDKNYHDTALEYLDQIAADKTTPKKVQELIPFERAMTLLMFSRTQRLPEEQEATLDLALAQLASFTKQYPNHPMAGTANTERGKIILEKAEVEGRKAQSPAEQNNKKAHQEAARKLVAQARDIFQKAYNLHEKTWKSFPATFIDKQKEPEKYEARAKAEIQFMSAQLDLAQCTYAEAQTYDPGSADYNRLLKKASEEYAKIHERYRSQVGGLYARMWQGKCFEEQGELGRALGIYNELLGHPGNSSAIKALKDNCLQFRLICLNDDKNKDYELVINEAEQWLKENRSRSRTAIGQGITWELARAQEALANQESTKKGDQERILRQALANARFVNAFRGKYRDVSRLMVGRINAKIQGNSGGDPQDFATAYGLGQDRNKQTKALKDKLAAAKSAADKKKAQVELTQFMEETARILRIALKLADNKTDPKELDHARFLLSYTYYNLRHSYECAILAELVARSDDKVNGGMSLDAAYLALAGYLQAYNDSPKDQRYVDNQHMEEICNLITSRWPESGRANDARIQLGNIYSSTERPAEAAKWFSQVPPAAPQYTDAQIRAGQAYWNSYLTAMSRRSETKPENAKEWSELAEKHLRTGIAATLKSLPAEAKTPEDLTAAKTSLAQIALNNGKYQDAIDILSKDPHAVLKAIHVAKGTKRPAKGVQSSEFANLVYQLQLRGYIGLQQIDLARKAMKELEESASGSGGESITEMYRQLGEKITEEIERLKAAGDTKRIDDVRKSLETFLTDIFKRKDQTYGSLVWIGETYYGMGQGASEDPAVARGYYDKAAAAFEEILKRQAATGDFIPGDFQVGITLRLVNCKREQGEYEAALKLLAPILKEKEKSPEVQFEAANLLQTWASSGQGDNSKKYMDAINGMELENGAVIKGWNYLARLLQNSMDTPGREDLKEMYYDAQYNKVESLQKYAIAVNDAEKLERAKSEINVLGQISVDLPDDVWERFNKLYRQIQVDMGEDPQDLARRVSASETVAANDATPLETETPADTSQKVAQQPVAQATGGSNTMIIVLLLLVGVGGAAAFYFFGMKPGKKSTRPSYQLATNVTMPADIPAPAPASPKPSRSASSKSAAPGVSVEKSRSKAEPEKSKTRQPTEKTDSDKSESGKEKRKLTPEQIAARKAKLAQMSPEEIAARKAAIAKKKAAQAKQQKQSRPRPENESQDS
ncbi:tetratricopeptide repeat protein [Gimesia sp.]|uniref:tetratricopeptide repeat protein n=1 Tax=Gimesia sp. TaxID=2024833 RepID=UPI000C5E2794|nr:tetratricopeptide repeat protein [Gimesia sp.]MAX39323.1 hypothetical protein [Gimesia sp.]|tara:strand:- start:11063 stop:14701 length:3639 start_codon:yes stop_codon:yes gene_type:complete